MRLFLCEKPSQGKDIAQVLGARRPGGGCYLGEDLIVTWCIGHLIEAAPPEKYDERYRRWSLEALSTATLCDGGMRLCGHAR